MKVAVGSDHAGFELKTTILKQLAALGHEPVDFGPADQASVDYPDYGALVARAVARGDYPRGILICGTGIGMSITANKIPGIRAALCNDILTARMSRRHNDANILALGARIIGIETAQEAVKEWMTTEFEGGRHSRRLDKIAALETRSAEESSR